MQSGADKDAPPRPEYPRPTFVRAEWASLNGRWEFDLDPDDVGSSRRFERRASLDDSIVVPFPVESPLSGIGDRGRHDVVWYARTLTVPEAWRGRRMLLHFGAVDYRAEVFVNGALAAFHEGGQTPFTVDLGRGLDEGPLRVVVRAEDRSWDLTQPRGKQTWAERSEGIFYTRTTGIWQSVWWEPVPTPSLAGLALRPRRRDGSIGYRIRLSGEAEGMELAIRVSDAEGLYAEDRVAVEHDEVEGRLAPKDGRLPRPWSPDDPHLYDVTLTLRRRGAVFDEVRSYLGFRDLEARDGRLYLNGEPYLLKMVLDQGYWPDGLLTAPSDEALSADVRAAKAMGFNGVRKHQKVEDPRFLYHADRLGLLVFGEMANAFSFSPTAAARLVREWTEVVERDYNHPALVAWVPVNESWGVPDLARDPRQTAFLNALYHLTKSLDPDRLVVSNDGWEHAQSDCLSIHDYAGEAAALLARYATRANILKLKPSGRPLFAPGHAYQGQPVLVSEMGGIAVGPERDAGWGYTRVPGSGALLDRYRELVRAVLCSSVVQGFCWTQLTDVEQEQNGLLTADRRPKLDFGALRAFHDALGPSAPDAGRT